MAAYELYLGFKHLEFTATSGPAEQLASVSGGHTSVLWYPLFHIPVVVQVGGTVVLLTLFLSETLS